MESLQIRTGRIRLEILDDTGNSRGVFSFNPTDVESAKKVMNLQTELTVKNKEFTDKANACTQPEEQVDLLNEIVDYFEGVIDEIFGAGSSLTLFGNDKSLSMFYDFFDGIMPYYQRASEQRMAKYIKPKE